MQCQQASNQDQMTSVMDNNLQQQWMPMQENDLDGDNVLAVSDLPKLTCYKCWEKGHGLKDCPNKVLRIVSGKDSHISSKCAWLRQAKPVGKFVGYATSGLSCFVVDHAKEFIMEDKNNTIALVKVLSGNLNAQQLAHDFDLTFPWKWEWNT